MRNSSSALAFNEHQIRFVVYDTQSEHTNQLDQSKSFTLLLIKKLVQKYNKSVSFLSGGFECFKSKYSNLCQSSQSFSDSSKRDRFVPSLNAPNKQSKNKHNFVLKKPILNFKSSKSVSFDEAPQHESSQVSKLVVDSSSPQVTTLPLSNKPKSDESEMNDNAKVFETNRPKTMSITSRRKFKSMFGFFLDDESINAKTLVANDNIAHKLASFSSAISTLTNSENKNEPRKLREPTKILDFLYLGSQEDALCEATLNALNIKCILNVSVDCLKPDFIADAQFLRIPVNDGHGARILPFFDIAYQFIEKCRKNDMKVLVHCLAGISRSPTLAIAFLMKYMNMKSDNAYQFVKEKRPSISPNFNFLGQLYDYEKQLASSTKQAKLGDVREKCLLINVRQDFEKTEQALLCSKIEPYIEKSQVNSVEHKKVQDEKSEQTQAKTMDTNEPSKVPPFLNFLKKRPFTFAASSTIPEASISQDSTAKPSELIDKKRTFNLFFNTNHNATTLNDLKSPSQAMSGISLNSPTSNFTIAPVACVGTSSMVPKSFTMLDIKQQQTSAKLYFESKTTSTCSLNQNQEQQQQTKVVMRRPTNLIEPFDLSSNQNNDASTKPYGTVNKFKRPSSILFDIFRENSADDETKANCNPSMQISQQHQQSEARVKTPLTKFETISNFTRTLSNTSAGSSNSACSCCSNVSSQSSQSSSLQHQQQHVHHFNSCFNNNSNSNSTNQQTQKKLKLSPVFSQNCESTLHYVDTFSKFANNCNDKQSVISSIPFNTQLSTPSSAVLIQQQQVLDEIFNDENDSSQATNKSSSQTSGTATTPLTPSDINSIRSMFNNQMNRSKSNLLTDDENEATSSTVKESEEFGHSKSLISKNEKKKSPSSSPSSSNKNSLHGSIETMIEVN